MPDGASIVERLTGADVLVTGVTGFVGEALLHRLLTQVPDARVTALVRPRGSASADDRIRSVLKKRIFADVVEQAGGPDALLGTRIRVLEGDMSAVPALPPEITAVVHCAGDVSFDPPVDGAFTTNVVGTRDLLARTAEVGRHVHYVHISTAYVAGRRRGTVPEGPVEHDVDVDAELVWGLAQRQAVEARSRDAERLREFRRADEREHRRAGLLTAAAASEDKRKEWVRTELVRLCTERARSVGWTDCYTFTKALGERVVERYAADAPVSIVRPSIIESAVAVPHPGWIEGFKMAEPLILAYGRGELPEFPAPADTAIDIVPIDHVVAAIVAVLATPPQPGQPDYFHVSSGARNPLRFGRFYETVRKHFVEHPFVTGKQGAAQLPEWRFPGAETVERRLRAGERAHKAADRVLSFAPRSDRVRDLTRRLDQQGRRLEFLRRYLDLYGEYVVADLRFDDANTLALFHSLDPADRADFAFDTAVVDWEHYITDVHCPAVTASIRRIDAARARRTSDSAPRMRPASAADGARAAAFFDLDGTLLSSNVVETFLWSRLPGLAPADQLGEVGRTAARLPAFLRAERHGRETFLRAVYRSYEGARLADIEALVDDALRDHLLSRLAPAAIRRVREHRAAGQPTVLITGAIRPLTRPLAPLFDHIEAVDLAVDARGVCTGELVAPPLVGESRAAWIRAWARRNDVDLAESAGYADSYSDLPLLSVVGHPVAVRPDVSLYRHARRRNWPIVDWASAATAGRGLNPAGADA